ncbi:MAG: nucleoside triphosphate pyrophosphohydrolase [Bacteroidetes bacterium]|jgi:MazG family protein|nr:nucleoside triphosphate pyrophosphohydrolase [Bacteroidota bacterium]MBT7143160.1 nucleoside triphosphate pyrophosphohydrolase [Bacteroidota bacterium]MBT7492603.1 nucleoside triphosphate pyrophosphohydrolase [Bacteroidota bacterium]
MNKNLQAFDRLLQIMDDLRAKCPWDKTQTLESLRTLTIEETYELADAIISNNMTDIKKELGDLMLHIVFYAKIGSETKDFDISDVINSLCDKLIFRHPHVYGNTAVADAEEVKANWEKLKLLEKGEVKNTVLSGVPKSLPALVKANRIQDKVRGVGFDWEEKEQIWEKVEEEFNELKQEILDQNQDNIESEFGDLFFSLINAARLYNINPENALERTNRKFIKRFNYLEKQTLTKGISLHDMTLEQMNKIWDDAKKYD